VSIDELKIELLHNFKDALLARAVTFSCPVRYAGTQTNLACREPPCREPHWSQKMRSGLLLSAYPLARSIVSGGISLNVVSRNTNGTKMKKNDSNDIRVTGAGGSPVDKLEERVSTLENDTREMKTDIAIMRSNYVTREDLHREVGNLKEDLQREVGTLKEDLQREVGTLKESIEKMGRVMIMWTAGSMLTVATLTLAIVRYMS